MALREIFAHFGFSFDRAKLLEVSRGVEGVKASTKQAGAGLSSFVTGLQGAVAAITGGVFLHFTNQVREQAAALQDTADQTGLSTDELQAWTMAAQLGGASAQDFVAGLRKVSKELATGVDESGQQSKLFKQLGIETKDAAGDVRELDAVLPEIADKFAALKSGAERSALAQQIFGKAGSKLVPILAQGSAGIVQLRKQFHELGGGFSEEAIKNADEYDDALIKLNFSMFAFKSLLATSVFPILSKIVETFTKASVKVSAWVKETTLVGNAIKVLAGIITGKLLLALAPFLLPGLKFLAIFLAVDDLVAFLSGKRSVIGDILDRWFGDGTATAVRAWTKDAGEAIKGLVEGSLLLLKLAFTDNQDEAAKIGDQFLVATRGITDAIDSVLDKLALLKEGFGIDTIQKGLSDALDVAESGVSAVFGTETRAQQRSRQRFAAPAEVPTDARGFAREAFSPFRVDQESSGFFGTRVPTRGTARAPEAPIVNNISPVSVTQTFGPGTGANIREQAKQGAREGVAAGLTDYRAALQDLEQRR